MADPSSIPTDGYGQILWLVGAGSLGPILLAIVGSIFQYRKAKTESASPPVSIPSDRYSGAPTDWLALYVHQIDQNVEKTLAEIGSVRKELKEFCDVIRRDRSDRLRAKRKRKPRR